jgi:hypothetical protein
MKLMESSTNGLEYTEHVMVTEDFGKFRSGSVYSWYLNEEIMHVPQIPSLTAILLWPLIMSAPRVKGPS